MTLGQRSKVPLEMRPADLAALGGMLVVSAHTVGHEDAPEALAHESPHGLGAPAPIDTMDRGVLTDRAPQPMQRATTRPRCLVYIGDAARAYGPEGLDVR